ncbi:hypothetical protein GSI_09111 [Ganoderma sinense ZZ0214-1]|uniref:Uncharacterized protein n=1 Tax=Ganoderma sinense ZZ0214-1 TaxID=1077348 RepID=A0A2G8S5M1_9APHY|nr:hypothetical protein GSI_09111 [Ganoderma sinense ZZ0214-1]
MQRLLRSGSSTCPPSSQTHRKSRSLPPSTPSPASRPLRRPPSRRPVPSRSGCCPAQTPAGTPAPAPVAAPAPYVPRLGTAHTSGSSPGARSQRTRPRRRTKASKASS